MTSKTPTLAHAIVVGNPLSGFTFYGPFLERGDREDSPLIDLAQALGFEADAPDGSTVVPLVALPEGFEEHVGVLDASAPLDLARRLAAFAGEVLDLDPEEVRERAEALAAEARAAGLLK